MTEQEQTLEAVRAEVEKLTVEQRAEVLKIAGIMRHYVVSNGAVALLALALIGAELAATPDEKV